MRTVLSFVRVCSILIAASAAVLAQTNAAGTVNGLGGSTYTCLDQDGDGYGVGPGCTGPDADDNDRSIHTGDQAVAKYGSLSAFLSHLGYHPANIYYVAPNGVDAGTPPNCKNNINAPCATYAYLRTSLAAGDMVILRNGWNGRIDAIGGSATGTNVIMSYPGELAVIDASASPGAQVNIADISYLTIDGLKVQKSSAINGGTADGLTQSDNHDITIRHLEGVGGGPQGLGSINAFNGLVNWTIQDNVLYYNDSSTESHCLYIGSRGLPNSNDLVQRNICYNAPWNGFHFNGRFTNLTVDQNIIYTTGIAGISLQEGVSNSRFTNNLIFNTASEGIDIDNYPGDCAQFGQGGTGAICPYDQTGNVFENNTVYMTGLDPTLNGQSSQHPAVVVANRAVNKVGDLGHNTFRNNIFYGPASGGHYPPVTYYDSDEPYLSTSVFTNNIFWSGDGSSMVIGLGTSTSSWGFQGYNCTGAAAITTLAGCLNADPKFVAASPTYWNSISSFNLRLQSSSPAVHAGTSTGVPSYDLTGTPFANPPTIGVYELLSTSTATPSACDLNSDGSVNILDVQIATLQTLGVSACTSADLLQNGQCSATDVQRVIDASLGGSCITGSGTGTGGGSIDTTPPVVSLSSPQTGTTISGITTVSANATDNVSVASVQFKLDGNNLGTPVTGAGPTFSFSWDTTTTVDGSHTLAALATDTSGNTTLSTAISIAVKNGSSTNTPTGGPFPIGWTSLSNTQLKSVCPPSTPSYPFAYNCQAVISAWSGGAADTKRNRLIIWGGGHNDYYGNEVYALNLASNPITLTRINNPSPINPDPSQCPTTLADGNPNSRHTYDGLAYMQNMDKMLSFGGGLACAAGGHQEDLWVLDMQTLQWQRMDPANGSQQPSSFYTPVPTLSAYDPNSGTVFLSDLVMLWNYNYTTNTYQNLNGSTNLPSNSTAVIDPKRKLFIVAGNDSVGGVGRMSVIDISSSSNYVAQDWTSQLTGCAGLLNSEAPGLAYDSALDRIVGWPNFGNAVYIFNPDTKSCTAQTFSGGPPNSVDYNGNPYTNGTFGRFQYFPSLNVFAVVNFWTNNAYILRLN